MECPDISVGLRLWVRDLGLVSLGTDVWDFLWQVSQQGPQGSSTVVGSSLAFGGSQGRCSWGGGTENPILLEPKRPFTPNYQTSPPLLRLSSRNQHFLPNLYIRDLINKVNDL